MSRSISALTAACRSGSVRTSSACPASVRSVCAKAVAEGPLPTTATGRWCGAGEANAPR